MANSQDAKFLEEVRLKILRLNEKFNKDEFEAFMNLEMKKLDSTVFRVQIIKWLKEINKDEKVPLIYGILAHYFKEEGEWDEAKRCVLKAARGMPKEEYWAGLILAILFKKIESTYKPP